MSFPKQVSEQVMVKCGRCCCLCRRFRPTLLQVHHIVEESNGGASDLDNAIALCIVCHSDVHTSRPFTQRFTVSELKQHRDKVYSLVESGFLIYDDSQVDLEIATSLNYSSASSVVKISQFAIKILCAAAEQEARIRITKDRGRATLQAGNFSENVGHGRRLSETESALEELECAELIKRTGFSDDGVWQVTLHGYEVADEAMAIASIENRNEGNE